MIALQLIREALADGVARVPVLGDAAYGDNAEFRAGLRALDLEFFLQVDAAKHKGWSFAVPTRLKQVRRHPTADAPPSQTLVQIAADIPAAQWQPAQWKTARGERGATGVAGGLAATRAAQSRRRTRETMAGGRLAGRCGGAVSLLAGSLASTAHPSTVPDAQPQSLAYRTILPTCQR